MAKVKILRAFDPFTKKTLQGGPATRFGTAVAKSWHDPSVLTRVVRRRKPVKRLHVNDPYNMNSVSGLAPTGATQATFSKEADQFTNNPNRKFDPSARPGSVTVKTAATARHRAEKPGKASRGHGNVIKRTIFNQTGGKRLRRR
jgi:hypothetical protein